MSKEEIIIGGSDMNLAELKRGGYTWLTSTGEYLERIKYYEDMGYEVKFVTSFFRRIFCLCKYKVVAYKK